MPQWLARGVTLFADDWHTRIEADNLREARRAVMAQRKALAQETPLRLAEIDIEEMTLIETPAAPVRAKYDSYRIHSITDQGRQVAHVTATTNTAADVVLLVIRGPAGDVWLAIPTSALELAVAEWNQEQG